MKANILCLQPEVNELISYINRFNAINVEQIITGDKVMVSFEACNTLDENTYDITREEFIYCHPAHTALLQHNAIVEMDKYIMSTGGYPGEHK